MADSKKFGALALLLATGVTGSALAQDTITKTPPATMPPAATAPAKPVAAPQPVKGQMLTQPDNTMLSTELVGANVHASDQEKAGTVTNLIFSQDGNLSGLVVGVGGFLGLGARSIALKREDVQIRMDAGKPSVTIAATKADLEAAPAFKSIADVQAERDSATARKTSPAPGEPGPRRVPADDTKK